MGRVCLHRYYRTILLIHLLSLRLCVSRGSTLLSSHHNQSTSIIWQSIDAFQKAFRNAGRVFRYNPLKGRSSKTNSDNRIVGGSAVAPGTYPSYVHTREPILCGGTLIYEDVILTAAHCLGGFLAGVEIGGVFRNGSDATTANVDAEFPHPDYSEETQFNDIMLVKLSKPSPSPVVTLNFDPTIPIENETLTVIGYGYTVEEGVTSDILLEVDVDTYTDDFCFDLYIYYDPITMVCAGSDMGGRDSCQGDSGGPIFNDMLVQVGVVASGSGCGKPKKPAIYTEVAAFDVFIQQGICDISDNPPPSCLGPTILPSSVSPSVSPFNTATVLPTLTSLPTTVASKTNPPSIESSPTMATSVPSIANQVPTIVPTPQNSIKATLTSQPTLVSSMTFIPVATIRPSPVSDAPLAASIATVSPIMSDAASTVLPTSAISSTSDPTVQSTNTIAPSAQIMAPNSTTATNQPSPADSTTTGPMVTSATTLEPSEAMISPNESLVPTTAPVLTGTMLPDATSTILPTFLVSATSSPTVQSSSITIAPSTLSLPANGSTNQPTSLFSATSGPTSTPTIETIPPKPPVVPDSSVIVPSAPPEILQIPIPTSTTRPTKTVDTTFQPTAGSITIMPSSMILEPVAPSVPVALPFPAAVPTPRQTVTSRPNVDTPTTVPPSRISSSPSTESDVTFDPTYNDAIPVTITPVSKSTRRPTSTVSAPQASGAVSVASISPTMTTLLDEACQFASSDTISGKGKGRDLGMGMRMGIMKGKGTKLDQDQSSTSGCTAGKGKGKGKSKHSGKGKEAQLDKDGRSGGGNGNDEAVSIRSKGITSEQYTQRSSDGDDDSIDIIIVRVSGKRAKSLPLLDPILRAKLISLGTGI